MFLVYLLTVALKVWRLKEWINLTFFGLDSTSDSSKRSRRESAEAVEEISGLHNESYEDHLIQDEGLLESYTKIWESF